ncbi:transglutaminase N-terminal domain-containing protein [Rhodoplanes sp. SY1]|uniref:transglutaminase family protein n=1 Tax=Rhodoplanes sp. SY1 TaxID=3166646 RepID=UPI0038B61622
MVDLRIRHRTTYDYRVPVTLWPHRLMMRPRESHELRFVDYALEVSPDASIGWAQDVLGNTVATATFAAATDRLVVDSVATVRLDVAAWPVFAIAASATSYPFRYADEEWLDLGPFTVPQHDDPDGRLGRWARGFVRSDPTDTLSLLKDLAAGVSSAIAYETRDEEGTRPPGETLDRGSGSCRDLATLLIEAARRLGFGARAVSGYLHDPVGDGAAAAMTPRASASTTHAWAEIYLPGAGWVTFDPTNRNIGGANLIPVAVARDIRQAVPVAGTFGGPADALVAMIVEVVVREEPVVSPSRAGAG